MMARSSREPLEVHGVSSSSMTMSNQARSGKSLSSDPGRTLPRFLVCSERSHRLTARRHKICLSQANNSPSVVPRNCANEATAAARYDAYITGEPAEPTLHLARELRIHFLAGGHYATETFGIEALAERIAQEFSLEWEFLDVPVPV